MTVRQLASLALFSSVLSTSALAQKVWVVDDNGGPGVDFLDVDPAVAAASDGDTILVKAGSYSDLVLNGRSLSVVGEAGQLPAIAGVGVRNVSAAGRVRIDGLKITSALEAGVQVKTCVGPVWIEDCVVTGGDGDGLFTSTAWHPDGHPGIQVVDAAALTVARCTVRGGAGEHYAPVLASTGMGGPGIDVAGASAVAVFDSDLFGGQGGDVYDDDAAWNGSTGGACILIGTAELFAVGNRMTSGGGGVGGEDYDPWVGYSCGNGGDAGHGIDTGWTGGSPTLHLAQNSFTSGAPGPPFPGASCSSGSLGVAISAASATIDMLAIDAFALLVTDPVREAATATVTVTGAPNSVVWLALAGTPAWLHLPTLGGLDLVDPLGVQLLPLGVTSGAGLVTKSYPAPSLVPAGEALELFTQVLALELGTAKLSLGSPAGLTLLDASL